MEGNRRLAKNTFISYIRLLTVAFFGLFSSRFLLESLGTDDFGLYSVVGSIVVMLGFINTVMIPATYRFISFEMGKMDSGNVNKVFNVSLLIHLLLSVFVLAISETAGVYYVTNFLVTESAGLQKTLFLLRFSTLAAICTIISIPYQGLLTAYEKFSVIAVIEVIKSFLLFLLSILLLDYEGNRLRIYALLVFVIMLLSTGVFLFYCYKNFYATIKFRLQRNTSIYKEMFGFSFWIMFGAAASVGQKSGSALLINNFFGTAVNASFGLASNLNGVVSTLSGSLSQAAVPQITKNFSAGNQARSIELAAHITKYTSYMMLVLLIPIIAETDILLKLWLGEVPPATAIMSKLILINSFFGSMMASLPGLIQATGKIKWFQIISSFISLMALPACWFLFKMNFPPYSIFFIFILSSVISIILWQFLLKKIMNFDTVYFMKVAYLPLLYVLMGVMPLFLLRPLLNDSLIVSLLFMTGIFIYTVFIIYLFGLHQREKSVISSNLGKLTGIFRK